MFTDDDLQRVDRFVGYRRNPDLTESWGHIKTALSERPNSAAVACEHRWNRVGEHAKWCELCGTMDLLGKVRQPSCPSGWKTKGQPAVAQIICHKCEKPTKVGEHSFINQLVPVCNSCRGK